MNDDMDRLIKKAADEYPLKTAAGDWDKIAGRIKTRTPDRRILVFLAAFLLLAVPAALWIYNGSNNTRPDNNTVTQKNTAGTETGIANNPDKNKEPFIAPKADILTNNSAYPFAKQNDINSAASYPAVLNKAGRNNNFSFHDLQPSSSEKPVINNNTASGINNRNDIADITDNPQNPASQNKDDMPLTPVGDTRTNANTLNETGAQKNKVIIINSAPGRFYAGMLISPVFTSVKSQQFKAGISLGLFAGVRINNNLSIETGIRKETRNIYTEGKYFSNEYLKLKNSTDLKLAIGKAAITNIPFFVRYNFPEKDNNNFFVSAGTNATIVHKEKYSFNLIRDGVSANVNRTFYSRPPNKVFTDIIISGGFEKKLMEKGRLRIEPWYSMPVNGLGMGQVKATNLGLNVGFSIDFK